MTFITKSAFKTSNENYSPCSVSVTKPFEAKKSNIDDKNNKGNTPIHLAASWGYTETVKLLLENGGDPYITNNAGETARDMDDTG